MFFSLFQTAIQVAVPPAHHPEIAHHENAARPTPSLPKVNTPKQLSLDCNSIAASISCRPSGQDVFALDLGEPLDAGNIPNYRRFAVSDVICFRFENADRSGRASLMNRVSNWVLNNRECGSKSP
jgi:hypothetical protein